MARDKEEVAAKMRAKQAAGTKHTTDYFTCNTYIYLPCMMIARYRRRLTNFHS
jgi:hypothetical protein